MDNFTYVVLGGVYEPSGSANLTVTCDGNQVFNGSVTSDPEPIDHDTPLYQLCSWTANVALAGTVNLQITADADQIFFAMLGREVAGNTGPIIVELEYPITEINSHAVSNVHIDGVAQPTPINIDKPETPGDIAGWHYRFDGATTFSCDYFTGPYPT